MKVIFSLCLILLAIKKNSSAMAKESNSESGGDAKKMYVVKNVCCKHVPAGEIWGKCLFGHVCYAVCADEDESYIFTYIICICIYICEGTYI